MRRIQARLTDPAMIVAVFAVVLSATGVGYAAATIGSSQIKNNSVASKDVRNNSIASKDVKNGTIVSKDINKKTRAALKGATGATGATGPAGPSSVVTKSKKATTEFDTTGNTAVLSTVVAPGSYLAQGKVWLQAAALRLVVCRITVDGREDRTDTTVGGTDIKASVNQLSFTAAAPTTVEYRCKTDGNTASVANQNLSVLQVGSESHVGD